jgi:hypothetical protein
MKKMKSFLLNMGLVMTVIVLNSCNNDEGYSLDKVWYSIATVNPLDDTKSFSLTLDDGTTLWPVSPTPGYSPKENQRALVMYTLLSDKFQGYDHAIKVYSLQNVLTKAIAEDLGDENNNHYGNDPVEMLDMWIGDGYLNVKFGFNYGGTVKHFINLVQRDSVNAPYFFEFRHHAYNDNEHVGQKGLVAFDLSTLDTGGQEIQLTIRVKTFDGEQDYTLSYHPKQPALGTAEKELSEHFVDIR